MRLDVDTARCQGHAVCLTAAPDLMDFDDDAGHARPCDDVPQAWEAAARRAAAACPERAITLRD